MAKKSKRIVVCAVVAAVLLALVIWIAWGNQAVEQTVYTITSKDIPESFHGYRIAQVSDLHNTQIGRDNEKLLALLRESDPDIIAFTGDLIDYYHTDIDVAVRFAEEAMKIAPCYFVSGNHEARESDYPLLKEELAKLGVVLLENKTERLERNGESISLLGVDDPMIFEERSSASFAQIMRSNLYFLSDEASYTILLSHRPELLEVYSESQMDLVLTGHAHGGQFRLPFVGGLLVPNQGWFPKYDAGLFTEGSTQMIISRGIGNSLFPFRVNNRPELVLVELMHE